MRLAWISLLLLLGSCEQSAQPCKIDSDCARFGNAVCDPSGSCRKNGASDLGTDGGVTPCEGSAECHNPQFPRCDFNKGMCAGCRPEMQAIDCGTATPICNVDGSCRKCEAHDDCASKVCNLDGTCAAESEIVYVNNKNGTCSGPEAGTLDKPFCEIRTAVMMGNKPIIRVFGSTVPYAKVSLSTPNLTLIGPGQKGVVPSARIQGDSTDAAFAISGNTTVVTIDGFEISGGSSGQSGLACVSTSLPPSAPTVTVRRSYIHDVPGSGLSAFRCNLSLDRNWIGPRNAGGLSITDSRFEVTNCFVVGNLSDSLAGVNLTNSEPIPGGQGFAFNTVVKNTNTTNMGVGGIACANKTVDLVNCLVIQNTTGNTGGTCNSIGTVIMTTVDPNFVSPGTPEYDYHLQGRTDPNKACCIDTVLNSTLNHDYDGRARPVNAIWDKGAHEVPL